MSRFFKILLLLFFGLFLCSEFVYAAAFTFGPAGSNSLQDILGDITVGPNPGVSSVNVENDALSDSSDTYWSITGAGGTVSTLIIELAGFADDNIFGIYDAADSSKQVEIFAGAAGAGDQSFVSIKADGSVFINNSDTGVDFAGNLFGYFLDSSDRAADGGGVWYSDTSLNSDNLDHMAAYQGMNVDTIQLPGLAPGLWTDNEFILAWEDLVYEHIDPDFDGDYNDFVVMVESVNPNPIPEPATMLLVGSGLIGLAGIGRRKFFKKS